MISRCESEALRQRITAEGFELISLDQSYPDLFDLDFTISTLNKLKPKIKILKRFLFKRRHSFYEAKRNRFTTCFHGCQEFPLIQREFRNLHN